MKRSVRLAISVVTGIAAAVVALAYASSVRQEAQAAQQEALARYGGELVAVCVASRDIEPGDMIDEGNVVVEEWVTSLLPRIRQDASYRPRWMRARPRRSDRPW